MIDFVKPASIEPVLDFPEIVPPLPMTMEHRNQLLSAIKETLNNVVRHAGASRVTVRMIVDAGRLLVSIHDDGCGFEVPVLTNAAPVAPGRNGLRNVVSRMAELGGKCVIDSKLGQGTTLSFELELPTPKPG